MSISREFRAVYPGFCVQCDLPISARSLVRINRGEIGHSSCMLPRMSKLDKVLTKGDYILSSFTSDGSLACDQCRNRIDKDTVAHVVSMRGIVHQKCFENLHLHQGPIFTVEASDGICRSCKRHFHVGDLIRHCGIYYAHVACQAPWSPC